MIFWYFLRGAKTPQVKSGKNLAPFKEFLLIRLHILCIVHFQDILILTLVPLKFGQLFCWDSFDQDQVRWQWRGVHDGRDFFVFFGLWVLLAKYLDVFWVIMQNRIANTKTSSLLTIILEKYVNDTPLYTILVSAEILPQFFFFRAS